MALKINIENLSGRKGIELARYRSLIKRVLGDLDIGEAELNLVFVDDRRIRSLNRKYLGRDSYTDVIAFPPGDDPAAPEGSRAKERFMGDIAVSVDRARRNAERFGVTFTEELALCVVHGILHLSGYDDVSDKDRKEMRRKEDELLRKK